MRRPAPCEVAERHRRSASTCRCPGEPPSSTSEPGTRPPPSTRSSSPMPVCSRATCGACDVGAAARARAARGRAAAPPRACRRAAGARLLDERVPLAAARALPDPRGVSCAAGGADEDGGRRGPWSDDGRPRGRTGSPRPGRVGTFNGAGWVGGCGVSCVCCDVGTGVRSVRWTCAIRRYVAPLGALDTRHSPE